MKLYFSGPRDHGLYMFTSENKVLLMRLGASVVWHISLPLINSFNKTETAIFLKQAVLPAPPGSAIEAYETLK